MPCAIHQLTFDCSDAYNLATFWADVLGASLHPDDHPGDPEALLQAADGSRILLFQRVPEGKTAKNRLHLDRQPQGVHRDDEVERSDLERAES